jgi:hypothetical protein
MRNLKMDKKLLLKIGQYLCPEDLSEKNILFILKKKFKKSIKINDIYSGYCIGEMHFVVLEEEIVEFFIVANKEESKWSLMQKHTMHDPNYFQRFNFTLIETEREISVKQDVSEKNYRIIKKSKVTYKEDISSEYTVWIDGSLKLINGEREGYSSVIILNNNEIIFKEAVKMAYVETSGETEDFSLLLALNHIKRLALKSPIIKTDCQGTFFDAVNPKSKLRRAINELYGKEEASLLLHNLRCESRANNIAHNLIENRDKVKKVISVDEMKELGAKFIVGEYVESQVIIPKIEIVITKKISLLERLFTYRKREMARFKRKHKLKIDPDFFSFLLNTNEGKSDKEIFYWLDNLIGNSLEIRNKGKRFYVNGKKLLIVKNGVIVKYEEKNNTVYKTWNALESNKKNIN